jgi:hypothetical protein
LVGEDNVSVDALEERCDHGNDDSAGAYMLTVNNGTGSGSHPAGATVPVSANTPPPGQVFAG